MFRCILKLRSERFACGTYLSVRICRSWGDMHAREKSETGSVRDSHLRTNEYVLVRIADLLRVHPARKEEYERRDGYEKQTRRKVRVHSDDPRLPTMCGVQLRQRAAEEPGVRDPEEVRLQHDLAEKERDDDQQL